MAKSIVYKGETKPLHGGGGASTVPRTKTAKKKTVVVTLEGPDAKAKRFAVNRQS
jgi:hypothetical protein